MKIYFAGSIRGGRSDAALYHDIIEHIKEKDIVLTVKPTYLYILSEYDADNPTITLGE